MVALKRTRVKTRRYEGTKIRSYGTRPPPPASGGLGAKRVAADASERVRLAHLRQPVCLSASFLRFFA